jgi:hypothetical protein
MEQDRLYKQHLKAIALMKPSIDSHQKPLKKFCPGQGKQKIVRIFNGSKIRHVQRTTELDSESMSTRSEPCPSQPPARPSTAMAKAAQLPRRAVSARAVHSKLPVHKKEKEITLEPSEITVEQSDLAVCFGADMWDTSDEMEEDQQTDSDSLDLDF